jgi:hydroxymethylglutaryl-CoA reductase
MIKGFSKLTKEEKRQFIIKNFLSEESAKTFNTICASNSSLETLLDGFSENVISSYNFPYSIVPNFLIDDIDYVVPMVTEESSIVAAAAKSAAFWYERGGFRTEIIGNTKNGQVHFRTSGNKNLLSEKFKEWTPLLLGAVTKIDSGMKKRGGGIQSMILIDKTTVIDSYYQIDVSFGTCDAMGANYMNSCLEGIAAKFHELASGFGMETEIIMSILSNYSPYNAVKVFVECAIEKLDDGKLGMSAIEFADKFILAVKIAHADVSRAVTHNKGFYNGVDAVALATGNDWRAIEANGHAFVSREGQYKSISTAVRKGNIFRFEATVPLQIGTVGGITALHPLAKISMEILKHPSATDLMKIIASAGLASNFAAVKSLITTGIQKGHMKMHLSNIMSAIGATQQETDEVRRYFRDKIVSHSEVEAFIRKLRTIS